MATIQFHGAAGEVTGSSHLLRACGRRILLDCGMIQGGREEDRRNRERFPYAPADLDAVVLSHAHIDHCGRLPLLVKRGFAGPIYTHRATADLVRVMLEDAARLAMADVEQENRRRARRGANLLAPWFDLDDVAAVCTRLRPIEYDTRIPLFPGLHLRLQDAGHILGAAIVELWMDEGHGERKLVYSGDLGPKGAPVMHDPTRIHQADALILESTYGDRLHRPRSETIREIREVLRAARQSGGNVLIPAFAVGRSQEVLYWLAHHHEDWELKRWTIFLDSPMARQVIEVYRRHQDLLDCAVQRQWPAGDDPFTLPNLRLVESVEESRQLNSRAKGCIFIAGSGMCNGGRIRHHLKHNLWRPGAHVMIVGYQAQNTLGRQLVDGARSVRIFGETIRVNATIHTVGGLSAHADQNDLMGWYANFEPSPPTYLVHGENAARAILAMKLRERFGARVELAMPGMEREI
jgi:metallo-beta-lactamase family protein